MPLTQDIDQAVQTLSKSGVVAIPTETVYGLAARIDRPEAIDEIFKLKSRPFFDPLIVHVHSVDQARQLVLKFDPVSESLAQHFWPGPLTLVLEKNPQVVSDRITSGLSRVGIRMPRHSMALQVLQKLGVPLAAPSANKFGKTSPSRAEHVLKEFPEGSVLVLDGGACEVGLESTVVLVDGESSPPRLSILRSGMVTESEMKRVLDREGISYVFKPPESHKESPGHMKHHYMPPKPLIWVEAELSGKALVTEVNRHISELPDSIDGVQLVKPERLESFVELEFSSDPVLAARELYSKLREAAGQPVDFLVFRKRSDQDGELWEAFKDRLAKASSLRLVGPG